MFYLLNLLLVIIYYYLLKIPYRDELRHKKMFAIIVGIHAVLFRALANPFNYVDTEEYSRVFEDIREMTAIEAVFSINYYSQLGHGYVILNWLVGQMTDSFQYMYAILAVLSVVPVIWYHYKVSNNMLLSLLIYFTYPMMYYMGFGVIRQHLACAFVLIALYYVGTWKKSLPIAVFAILCHTSAIIFFPMYIIRLYFSKDISFGKTLFMIVGGMIIAKLALFTLINAFSRYEEGHFETSFDGGTLPAIVMSSVMVLYFIANVRKSTLSSNERDCVLFLLYGLVLSFICMGLQGLGRLTIYNMYVMPVLLSILLKYCNVVRKIYIKLYVISFTLLIYYLWAISDDTLMYIPYWSHIII